MSIRPGLAFSLRMMRQVRIRLTFLNLRLSVRFVNCEYSSCGYVQTIKPYSASYSRSCLYDTLEHSRIGKGNTVWILCRCLMANLLKSLVQLASIDFLTDTANVLRLPYFGHYLWLHLALHLVRNSFQCILVIEVNYSFVTISLEFNLVFDYDVIYLSPWPYISNHLLCKRKVANA